MTERPRKVWAGHDRDTEGNVREGDIPAFFQWADGSEYEVVIGAGGGFTRRYHGPLFGRAVGDWHSEFIADSTVMPRARDLCDGCAACMWKSGDVPARCNGTGWVA